MELWKTQSDPRCKEPWPEWMSRRTIWTIDRSPRTSRTRFTAEIAGFFADGCQGWPSKGKPLGKFPGCQFRKTGLEVKVSDKKRATER